jgi:N,N'-diacetyllegionaminate synthase
MELMLARLLSRFSIGERLVGPGEPVYVIAEAGSNHNRDLDTALRLIDVAAASGADAIKFQTYSGARIYSRRTPAISSLAVVSDKAPADLLEEISLPRDWQKQLLDHATRRGIHFFSTPFDHEAVEELDALGVPVMKVSSFEIGDLPLIRRIAATGRPMIISTGMATLGEIEEALEAVTSQGGQRVALLQCTSIYPAPPRLVNLRAMDTLARAFGVPVGLSDHTKGAAVAIAAAARGATVIEKHFTLDRAMRGPDHPFSLEPQELTAMVSGIRDARAALGDGLKLGPSPEEREESYLSGRRSLIATCDLTAGTVLAPHMVTTKRPGLGIAPRELERVLGRALTVDVQADDILKWEML